ncbi:MAG: glycosyltransferase family 39 protein [Caldilineaceae bacterium]|nr:glycosyltransferase family 39 protein [Caldilineaceae bacterium]
MNAPRTRNWKTLLWTGLGLAAVLGLASWLRWQYVTTISLYVDEFTTLWATGRLLESGAPIMPSGVLYTRGLLATYVTALFAAIGGLSYTVGRLPSLFFGLATIVLLLAVGWRTWRAPVGWLAAIGLAVLPEAIVWSGRARFYAQLQFFALLALWTAYVAIRGAPDPRSGEQRSPQARAHLVFALFFVLALFSQEQTLLLYPPVLIAMVLWHGWRYLLHRNVWPAQVIVVAAMLARLLIELVGQPGYFQTIQAERPYVGLIFDVPSAWRAYAQLLVTPDRLVWTLLGAVAIGAALAAAARTRWRVAALPGFHQATLFFALHFGFVLIFVLTLVSAQWRESRYLFLVQPNWLLLGAAGAVWLVDNLLPRPAWRWTAIAAAAVLLAGSLWQPAQRVLAQQTEGYDRVLAYVAAHLQPGDVVMSPQPPACALALGRPCDYYAVQRIYEEYVIPRDGVLVDRWSGAELLNDADRLGDVIRSASRVWFITDGFRLATRYEADFLSTVVDQFDVAFEERGVVALLATGWREAPPAAVTQNLAPPRRFGLLDLIGWTRSDARPGQPLDVTLNWQAAAPIDRQINTSLRLVAPDGRQIGQEDGPPARGIIPTNLFFEMPLPDHKQLLLPPDLPPSRYRLDVTLYDASTVTPYGEPAPLGWFRVGPPVSLPAVSAGATWQNGIRLLGHDGVPAQLAPDSPLTLRLVWLAEKPVASDYTVFVHLVGPDGSVVAQSDHAPEGGFYPTSAWATGDPVADSHTLQLPATLAPGAYRLLVGLYQHDTGSRLLRADGTDTFVVQAWQR